MNPSISNNRGLLFGKKIQICEPVPKMRCSSAFERIQSPELVKSTNEWMASFFGWKEPMKDGEVYDFTNSNTLVMNRNTLNAIIRKMENAKGGEEP